MSSVHAATLSHMLSRAAGLMWRVMEHFGSLGCTFIIASTLTVRNGNNDDMGLTAADVVIKNDECRYSKVH